MVSIGCFLRGSSMDVVYVSCPRVCTFANYFGMVVGKPFEIQRNMPCTWQYAINNKLSTKKKWRIHNNRNKNLELRDLCLKSLRVLSLS